VPPHAGEARAAIEAFHGRTRGLTTEELQELYTRTFDLNPVCSPELGWHLFGERYERGLFLVKLRRLMRRVALAETTELPDHLAGVLELLPRLGDDEAADLAAACVLPAVAKMGVGLDGKDNPYQTLLDLAARLVEARYGLPRAEAPRAPALRVVDDGQDARTSP
jgi:nitrate reductase delta subunit